VSTHSSLSEGHPGQRFHIPPTFHLASTKHHVQRKRPSPVYKRSNKTHHSIFAYCDRCCRKTPLVVNNDVSRMTGGDASRRHFMSHAARQRALFVIVYLPTYNLCHWAIVMIHPFLCKACA